MARLNERNLELSFKRYGNGRKGGRCYTRVGGKPVYYGTSKTGVSDRESYATALSKFKAAREMADAQAAVPTQLSGIAGLLALLSKSAKLQRDELECLMSAAGYQVQTLREGAAFEFLEVRVLLTVHLLVQNLDAIEAHVRGAVDALLDLDLLPFEVPEGVSGNADSD